MKWEEVRSWRAQKRLELKARFRAMRPARKRRADVSISERIRDLIKENASPGTVIGGYWPIKGEVNLSILFRELDRKGYQCALPVVVEKNKPVEFWRWMTGMPMNRGIWDIPVPATRDCIVPKIIIVPLVGFDDLCFRLGNGGGYYDRTLAAFSLKPFCIGVGYSIVHVPTIYPQEHDVPMDFIVTENDVLSLENREISSRLGDNMMGKLASSACSMAEADPTYFGFMSASESLDFLLSLLKSVRATAEVAMEIALFGKKALGATTYLDLAYGGIHASMLLRGAANRLTLEPQRDADTAIAYTVTVANQKILNDSELYRLHDQLAREIRAALPKISEPRLYNDLTKILRLQERALARITEAQKLQTSTVRNAG